MADRVRGRVVGPAGAVPGVVVSDGRHVTRTGEYGEFSLPGHGPFVFVRRPTGHSADPWFAPASAADVTFELVPEEQPVPFAFVHVTDLHLSLGDPSFGPGAGDATIWFDEEGMHERIVTTPAVFDDLLRELASRHRDVRFVVATGDLTNNGTDPELAALAGALARSSVPVHAVPGNHDHHGAEEDLAGGRTLPWERHVGPRWFSFDHGGVHFAAIDWFTHLLGVDREVQDAWLAADLAAVAPGTPVVLLTHDQMSSEFYRSLPQRPIASFSGHWHTTRVADAEGTRHYNTGTATFGGLDYSPAHYRVCTWDGTRLEVTTVARGPALLAGATFRAGEYPSRRDCFRWAACLDGGMHLGGPVVHGELVLVASKDEDRPRGTIAAFDLATGARRWSVGLASAVKAAPLVVGDAAVAVSVTGETVCVDVQTGAERWRVHLDDPLLLWVYLRPVTDGHRVYVGDVGRFAGLDLADGQVVWSRADLGQRENLTSLAHPAVVAGVLLVGFAGQVPSLWALDPATGATIWPLDVDPGSMYRRPATELVLHLPQVAVAGLTPDPGGTDVYAVRLGARIERLRAADGSVVWAAPFAGWFNPAAPAVHGDTVLATTSMGEVWCFDRADGTVRWRTDLGHDAPVAMGCYRAGGPALLGGPTAVGERVLVPLGDGRIAALGAGSGEPERWVDSGVPIAAPLAVGGDVCIAAGVDGVLRAVPLDALLSGRAR